nr:diaminopimelate epimerase [Senegalia massiliensis]
MKFTKMHGAGNDFIIINNIIEKIPEEKFSHIAKTLCSRRLSIGADGIMFLDNTAGKADYKMNFLNSDGTHGEMCGNGARCICRYGFEKGLAGKKQIIETISGLVEGVRIDKRRYEIRLNKPTVFKMDFPLEYDGNKYDCSYVELGDLGLPHLIVKLSNLHTLNKENLYNIGKGLRQHKKLKKGANVTFYFIDNEEVYAKTFERGVEDFTLACGTGAGSLGFTLIKKDIVNSGEIRINMPGGILNIILKESNGKYEEIFLVGPTNIVCEGIILDEDFNY